MSTKVLVAEDFKDVRNMMATALRRDGYDVIEASDGYEAVEKAVEERPDVILLDIAMPALDGIQAATAIRQHEELLDTPIIAVTAYGDFYKDRARDVGCNEVVQKPVDMNTLRPLIEKYWEH